MLVRRRVLWLSALLYLLMNQGLCTTTQPCRPLVIASCE